MNKETHRFKIGSFECVSVSDGTHVYAPPVFPPPASFLFVNAPRQRLEQVFCNLLDNAIKNSPAKGEVIVNGRRCGTDSIEIHVIDDGPGIPPEQVPFVFDRFYQAGGIRTGVGLGLAIAKEIIVAHGGTIEASSTAGAGTEFIVRLSVGSPESLEPGTPS